MSGNSSEYYKELFKQEQRRREKEQRRREEAEEDARHERHRNRPTTFVELLHQCHKLLSIPLNHLHSLASMSGNGSENYKELKELLEQEKRRREEAEEDARRERHRSRPTTFVELLHQCHKLLSIPLKADDPSRSTTGTIALPTGKYCPTRIKPWVDCPGLHQQIYDSVRRYLQPENGDTPRLFSSRIELEGLSRRITSHAISSEQGLEIYERFAVDNHVGDIIAELCKIPAAREEFRLGSGVRFDNHTNSLEKTHYAETAASQPSRIHRPRPDDLCIHVVDDTTNVLIISGEYKAPHKFPTETIRLGLRPMNLWDEMVGSETIPTGEMENLRYSAERLVSSAIVQQYHVMIQEGLEVSYVTNGFCDIHLWVPHDDPSTLHYYLYDPNREVDPEDCTLLEPGTAIARRLCLLLLSCRYPIRTQEWRAAARDQLRIWQTNFDHVRSQVPQAEPGNPSLHSDSSNPDHESPDPNSEYQPSSSPPMESPTAEGRRVPTRSLACRASHEALRQRAESPDSSGSDTGPAVAQRKRGISQVSPSAQPSSRPRNFEGGRGNSPGQHDAQFCTLHCLLGLQRGCALDDKCPNIRLHQQDEKNKTHPITAEQLVHSLKKQLGRDLDRNCTPFGHCGRSGAPFKLTCATYGYTVIGKGTTTDWWPEVAREADAYRTLQKAQGSAVPIFLGTIDLLKMYFLHGAGEIRHMLVMGWGGESPEDIRAGSELWGELKRSVREIRRLGVIHGDLRRENILWNTEVRRILIIDFHESKLVPRRTIQQLRRAKRPSGGSADGIETRQPKRLRVL